MFDTYLNYWQDYGNSVRKPGLMYPKTAMSHSNLVLLIHGYNNDIADATGAYKMFVRLLNQERTVNANLVGVYWPGDNWEGALYYMQAIGQAKKVAPNFAQDIYNAAKAKGYLKINIVAHSLGCRLALETIRELLVIKQREGNLGGLVINRIVFMAGAIPVKYLEESQYLSDALKAFDASLSLYSQNDSVLHWAFPAGQTATGEGFFPVALGRKEWTMGKYFYPELRQDSNPGAGHSDYWGGKEKNLDKKKVAVSHAATFLDLGPLLPREISGRVLAHNNNVIQARDTAKARSVAVR